MFIVSMHLCCTGRWRSSSAFRRVACIILWAGPSRPEKLLHSSICIWRVCGFGALETQTRTKAYFRDAGWMKIGLLIYSHW